VINAYEVTLKLVNKNTREVTSVTRLEHSYGVADALMQAVYNQSAEIDTGSADITVTHIGPPAKLVQEAEVALELSIARLVRDIGSRK
jgi:hypothetical protein